MSIKMIVSFPPKRGPSFQLQWSLGFRMGSFPEAPQVPKRWKTEASTATARPQGPARRRPRACSKTEALPSGLQRLSTEMFANGDVRKPRCRCGLPSVEGALGFLCGPLSSSRWETNAQVNLGQHIPSKGKLVSKHLPPSHLYLESAPLPRLAFIFLPAHASIQEAFPTLVGGVSVSSLAQNPRPILLGCHVPFPATRFISSLLPKVI